MYTYFRTYVFRVHIPGSGEPFVVIKPTTGSNGASCHPVVVEMDFPDFSDPHLRIFLFFSFSSREPRPSFKFCSSSA